jgi:CheW-like domain
VSNQLEKVLAALDAGVLHQQAEAMLADMGASEPGAPRQLADHYLAHIEGVAQALRDVCPEGDDYELPQTLANAWLELRLIWNRCNQQMQYQNMQGGATAGLMAAGALLGQLLETLRQFLDTESLLMVEKIGTDPYAAARRAAEQNTRLFERMSNASEGGNRAVEVLLMAQDQLHHQLEVPETRRALDTAVEAVVDEIERALVLTGEDIGAALEARLLKAVDGASVRVLPQLHGFDSNISLPPDVGRLLVDVSVEWTLALKALSLARSTEQRIADQKSAFVTLNVQIGLDANDVILTFSDDGDGNVVYARNQRSDAIRNVRLNLVQTAGSGSRLEVRCSLRKVNDYLVVRCIDDSTDGWLAVPMRSVQAIEQRSTDHLRVRGSVLAARDGFEAISVADVGSLLFNVNNLHRQEGVYVMVQPDRGNRMALRVSSIEGTRRAALRAVPEGLRATRLRGFIQSDGRVVGVLDIAEVSRLHIDACQA